MSKPEPAPAPQTINNGIATVVCSLCGKQVSMYRQIGGSDYCIECADHWEYMAAPAPMSVDQVLDQMEEEARNGGYIGHDAAFIVGLLASVRHRIRKAASPAPQRPTCQYTLMPALNPMQVCRCDVCQEFSKSLDTLAAAPAPSGQTKCFACDRKLGKNPHVAITSDLAQTVLVGSECYKNIGDNGWQPPTGGPRLYRAPNDVLKARTQALAEQVADAKEELDSVLGDWNSLVKAIGSPTNGGAVGYGRALAERAEKAEDALAQSLTPEQQAVAAEEIAWRTRNLLPSEVLAIMQKHAGRKG